MNLRDVIQPAPKRTIRRDIGGLAVMMAVMGLVLAGIGQMASCSASQKAAEHAAIACAEGEAVKALEPAVESILTTGGVDWEAQLLALGANGAINELSCAVQFVHDLLGANGSAVAAGSGSVGADEARSRAETFLNDLASGKRSVPHRTAIRDSAITDDGTQLSMVSDYVPHEESWQDFFHPFWCESRSEMPLVSPPLFYDGCRWVDAASIGFAAPSSGGFIGGTIP